MAEGKDPMSNVPTILAGLKGPTVFNGEMSRLSPGLRFVDAVPAEVKAELNQATPAQGPILDPWVQRKPGNRGMK